MRGFSTDHELVAGPGIPTDMTASRKNPPAIEGGRPVRSERLPFHKPPVDETDVASVAQAVRSGWLTAGPLTERFEQELERYLRVRHVVAVSSCSEAMFLALKAVGVGPGDEVVTSALTFPSTVHAILHTGATPVLCDIEAETFGPSPAGLERRITNKTKACMPVHFGGQACRIDEICDLAGSSGIRVVEDAAHGFGATYRDRKVGAFGDATAFSFYATKNLTTGEGGCVSTGNGELADRIRKLSYHGMSRDTWSRYTAKGSWYYEVEIPGFKANMSDILAALGLSQLEKADILLDGRRAVANSYLTALGGSRFFELPPVRDGNYHTWHLFVIRLRLDELTIDRDRFIEALGAENIGSSVHFIPVYRHPFFREIGNASSGEFPACEDYFSRCISLPIFPGMGEGDAREVVEALEKIASYYART